MSINQKKCEQLGMKLGTASNRLVKDLLFSFAKAVPCHQCGGELSRSNFSIEHKTPWLDSDDPKGLFFDLDNITFSHLSCNLSAARRTNKKYDNASERGKVQCKRYRDKMPEVLKKEKRQDRYTRTGN